MVITTHMYNQMNKKSKEHSKNEVLENTDSATIKSFLKNSDYYQKTEKTVISSNS